MSDTPKKTDQPAQAEIKKSDMSLPFSATPEEGLQKAGYGDTANSPLFHALQSAGSANSKAPRLAFTENPNPVESNYLGLYKVKRKLLPDDAIKQIRVTDHLVAAILRAYGAMVSIFGHLKKDRFDVGVEVSVKQEFFDVLTPEQHEKVVDRVKKFERILMNCGHTDGLEHQDRITLAQFLDIQTQNGMSYGRMATEIVYDREGTPDEDGNYPFHRFRPVDVSSIYRCVRKGEEIGNSLREKAIKLLESMTGDKVGFDLSKLKEDKYAWMQVVDGQPNQAFTHDEMLVFNFFPSTDIDLNGYPVSPLDTVVSSVTTHLSIDAYQKLYFQNGRATRGMLVIKSDEVDQSVMDGIKLQFNASINSLSNSFRTPIFGMGKDDDVSWMPFSGESANGNEFQYIFDQISRNIMSAFNIEPSQLPAYGHLARPTGGQTLSESNNEAKIESAKNAGLRPLVLKLQTFLNQSLFPIIDPLLAKVCEIKLTGLDAQSVEQEQARLQQGIPVHMTQNEVLRQVGKPHMSRNMGGDFPLSERVQLIFDKYKNVGDIMGTYFGDNSAFVNPLLAYKRDAFALQAMQLAAQANPMLLQAYFAPRPHALDILKMCIQDSLEEDEE